MAATTDNKWVSWGRTTETTIAADSLDPGSQWEVQVRQITSAGAAGDWSDSVVVTTQLDAIPPSKPSTPKVESRLGVVTVTWNGRTSGGVLMEGDFRYLNIYLEGVAEPVGVLNRRGSSAVLTNLAVGQGYTFYFVAYDSTGNPSEPSDRATVTVRSVFDEPEAETVIREVVMSSSNGSNKTTYSGNPAPLAPDPDAAKRTVNDLWFQRNTQGVVLGQWHWSGSVWLADTLSNVVVTSIDAGAIKTGTLDGARITAGTITGDKIKAGEITASKLSSDAIDGKTISGAVLNIERILTNGRIDSSNTIPGFYMSNRGYFNVVNANAERMLTVDPDTGKVTIQNGALNVLDGAITGATITGSTFRTGTSGARAQIETNGRQRVWLADGSTFMDLNPTLTSQNFLVNGGMRVEALNLKDPATSSTIGGIMTATSAEFSITATGSRNIRVDASGDDIFLYCRYPGLTAAATNQMAVRIDTGQIGLFGSSRTLKVNIEDHEFTGSLLDLNPRQWLDKASVETYAGVLDKIQTGEEITDRERLEAAGALAPVYGLIAEEVEAAGLGEFVGRGRDGEFLTLQYDRLWIPLIPEMRALRDRIDRLERQLEPDSDGDPS